MTGELVVIALGGNAIKQAHESGTTEEQLRNVEITADQIARIARKGYRIIVTHGNGPQAGALLIQQEEATEFVPAQTLAACGAMTQGQIGWMMQNRISYHLQLQGLQRPACTVVTQVVVAEDDPDFLNPSKPVGPFYTKETALALRDNRGYVVKEVKPGVQRSWRRVVPSPEPIEILEEVSINKLLDAGVIVIASGGGGIPVCADGDGSYRGVDAVIDKDRAAFKLAQAVRADKFMILTDVARVCLNYKQENQKFIETADVNTMELHLREGHFLAGSMGPKVEAAIRFVKWSKGEAIITSLDRAIEALEGSAGTRIVLQMEN